MVKLFCHSVDNTMHRPNSCIQWYWNRN